MNLILPPSLLGQIEAEARRAFPRECCGLIAGVRRGSEAQAFALHPAPDGEADHFAIAPEFHFAALRKARRNGRVLIGCYHSHPGGMARPSEADANGAGEENFFWLIAALDDAEAPATLKAYCWSGGAFAQTGWATGADWVTSSS